MNNELASSLKPNEKNENGLSLKNFWYVIRKHIIAFVVLLIVGLAGGFAYDRFQPNQYQTSATLMGNKGQTSSQSGGTYQDYYLADYVSQTLVDFVTQHRVLQDTISYLCNDPSDPIYPGLGYGKDYISFNELQNGISAKSSSLFVKVTFKMAVRNPNDSKFSKDEKGVIRYHMNVLNALCDTVVSIANETKPNEKGEKVARYPFFNNNIDVMSKADDTKLVSRVAIRVIIGGLIGIAVAVVYVLLRQGLDNRFKDASEVERVLGLPVLASIPQYTLADFPNTKQLDENNSNSSKTNDNLNLEDKENDENK